MTILVLSPPHPFAGTFRSGRRTRFIPAHIIHHSSISPSDTAAVDPPRGYGRDWHRRPAQRHHPTTMAKLQNLTKSLLGAHSCTNARHTDLPDITGLGSFADTPRTVDSVRTVFHRSRSILQLRTTHAP